MMGMMVLAMIQGTAARAASAESPFEEHVSKATTFLGKSIVVCEAIRDKRAPAGQNNQLTIDTTIKNLTVLLGGGVTAEEVTRSAKYKRAIQDLSVKDLIKQLVLTLSQLKSDFRIDESREIILFMV